MAKITINEATGECTILLERKDEFRRKKDNITTITPVGVFRAGELICNDKFHLIMVRGDE